MLAGARSPGNVAARLADAALVVGEDGDAVQREIRGEDVELVARPRARAVHHRDGREGPAPGGSVSVAAIDADTHLTLPEGEAACSAFRST